MGQRRGTAPRTHFLHRPTTDKLTDLLDEVAAAGAAVVVVQYVGGRDWVVVTQGFVPGPAGRRVFQQREE